MQPLIDRVMPQLKSAVADAATAATPAVKEVFTESVMPAVILGMVASAAVAAAIGSWFATRRR